MWDEWVNGFGNNILAEKKGEKQSASSVGDILSGT
jgi:hypothetical protein